MMTAYSGTSGLAAGGFNISRSLFERRLKAFYNHFLSLTSLHRSALGLSAAGMLDREFYDDQRALMVQFWRLYDGHDLKRFLTREQQTEVVSWITHANVELLRTSRSLLSGLDLAPLFIVVLVIGGVSVTLGVTYILANELTDFISKLDSQKKALEARQQILTRVDAGTLTPDQAQVMLKDTEAIKVQSGSIWDTVVDTVGRNITLVAIVVAAGFAVSMFRK